MKTSTTNTLLLVAGLAVVGAGGYYLVKKLGEESPSGGSTAPVSDDSKPKGDQGRFDKAINTFNSLVDLF